MSYNKDTDYQEKINEAVSRGDYESAANYEKSRNEKIDGEGLSYEKTSKYAGFLDKTDYGTVLNEKMSTGASRSSVAGTLKQRIAKASGTTGLEQYAYDDIYDRAVEYIMGKGYQIEQRPAYAENTKYSAAIEKILGNISQKSEFSYNPFDDELYRCYREAYLREGARAMEDTLGRAAENTGGVASSYAASAASQAYNYYAQKAADKIPELYSLKYKEYADEYDRMANELEELRRLSNDDYQRYETGERLYREDRDFAFNSYLKEAENALSREKLARQIYESDRDHSLTLDEIKREIEQTEYDREWEKYRAEQSQSKTDYENALKKWQTMGYLDDDTAAVLNLPSGLKTSDYDYKQAQKYKIYSK